MGGFSRALDTAETPASLRRFDEAVLGWGGGLICVVGVIFNLLLITVLVRERRQRLVYNVVLAFADIALLVVWGTYYSLTYLVDVVQDSNTTVKHSKREMLNFYMEPVADFVQTCDVWFLLTMACDVFMSVSKSEDWRRWRRSSFRVVVTVVVVILASVAINLPKIICTKVYVPSSMSWSAPPNSSSIPLYDHDLYIWIYEYILNYLLRFIVPFISLSVVVFRTNLALTPVAEGYCSSGSDASSNSGSNSSDGGSSCSIDKKPAGSGVAGGSGANRCQLMSIGACLLALVCYAPFLVNYAIYAAWILDDSAAAAAAVADDVSVRKFNTFCYVFIMAGSAFRIGVYAVFNPKLIFRNSSCCRLGGVAKRKLFGAEVDRYGRVIVSGAEVGEGGGGGSGEGGGGGSGGGRGLGATSGVGAANGVSMNGYDNHVFRY